MSTPAQINANIANSKLSTGPATEAGKAASSANSQKHGLTARKIVVMPGEDEAAYHKMRENVFNHWKPANAEEEGLVQLLCDTQWRLDRVPALEARAWSGESPDFKAIDNISKHGARLQKMYFEILQEVRTLVNNRRAQEQAQMVDAMAIRSAGKSQDQDLDPRDFGFVLTREQVDTAIRRKEALEAARKFNKLHPAN